MAKRRKEPGEGEEDLDFKIPKFDREKYLAKEKRNVKTMFIAFAFGILMAAVCFGLWVGMGDVGYRWGLVFILMIASASFIRYLYQRLKIDLEDFGRNGWLKAFGTYIFTWLLVMIVLVNPPFYDGAGPEIEAVCLPNVQEPGGTVIIAALITDNVGVENIVLNITNPDGTNMDIRDYTFENNILLYEFQAPNTIEEEQTYTYSIVATDKNGIKNDEEKGSGSFKISENTIVLTTPENGSEIGYATPIEFKVDKDVYDPVSGAFVTGGEFESDFRMYYTLNDGEEINVNRLNPDDRDIYRSTPEFKGWSKNTNYTLKAYVEVEYYFINHLEGISNTIEDSRIYSFSTKDTDGYGNEDLLQSPLFYPLDHEEQVENPLNYYQAGPRTQRVPGFELVVFVIALIAAVLIFKYKKKDKRN